MTPTTRARRSENLEFEYMSDKQYFRALLALTFSRQSSPFPFVSAQFNRKMSFFGNSSFFMRENEPIAERHL
jgi:hypothetical protein